MSKEAAERIIADSHEGRDHIFYYKQDAVDVARAYLALLAPSEDDEKVARALVKQHFCEGSFKEIQDDLTVAIAQALSAARARQREADAKIATDDADRNIEAAGRANMCGDVPSALHHELEASTGYRIAAAIRGAP